MTAALEGGERSAARPGRTLPPGKTRYPLYRRLVGPQDRSGRAEKSRRHRDSIPDRPARSSVAITTGLPGPPLETKISWLYKLSFRISSYAGVQVSRMKTENFHECFTNPCCLWGIFTFELRMKCGCQIAGSPFTGGFPVRL